MAILAVFTTGFACLVLGFWIGGIQYAKVYKNALKQATAEEKEAFKSMMRRLQIGGVEMSRLLTYRTIMVIFNNCCRQTAYDIIREINNKAVKDGLIKLFVPGKVAAELVNHYYGYDVDALIEINAKVKKKAPSVH